MAQFIRDYKLFIGTVESEEGFLCAPPLQIEFFIHKSIVNRPNLANFKIYNLNSATRGKIQGNVPLPTDSRYYYRSPSPGFPILLTAGYERGFGARVLFNGVGKWVFQYKRGTDIITEIIATENEASEFRLNSYVAKTFEPGNDGGYNGYLQDLTSRAKDYGLTLDTPNIADAAKCTRGRVFCGYDEQILTDMSKKYNSSWYITEGKLNVIPRGYFNTNYVRERGEIAEAIDVDYDTGLLGPPELTSTGINVKMQLDPLINVGTALRILPNLLQPAGNPDFIKETGTFSTPASVLASDDINGLNQGAGSGFPFAPLNRANIYRVVDIRYNGSYKDGQWIIEMIAWDADIQPRINQGAIYGNFDPQRGETSNSVNNTFYDMGGINRGETAGTSYISNGRVNVIEGNTIN